MSLVKTYLPLLLSAFFLAHCGAPEEAAPAAAEKQRRPPPPGIFPDGEQWQDVHVGQFYADGPAVDRDGNIYFATIPEDHIYKVDTEGSLSLFDDDAAYTLGMMFGPDGRLYACRNGDAKIVAYSMDGSWTEILSGVASPIEDVPGADAEYCNDLVVRSTGEIYFTDRALEQVTYIGTDGESRIVAEGFRPNGIVMSPDESMLIVGDSHERRLWAFTIEENGDLSVLEDHFDPVAGRMKVRGEMRPGTNGMTFDSTGRIYVTSYWGIEVFEPTGKRLGLLDRPSMFASNIVFGGPDFDILYLTGTTGIHSMKTLVTGAPYFLAADGPAEAD